jgi:hypothetical protein
MAPNAGAVVNAIYFVEVTRLQALARSWNEPIEWEVPARTTVAA